MFFRSIQARLTVRFLLAFLLVAAFMFSGGVSYALASSPDKDYQLPSFEDFSALSWTLAFSSLHAKFSREYAFTEWKSIDWNALYSQFQPRIAQAEAGDDRNAYYLALREYLHSIPDGHVGIDGYDLGEQKATVGGGFGLTIAKLNNNQVVVTWVKDGGPAAAAGIKPGALILEWNGTPVMDAIEATSILFGPIAPTNERRLYEQVRFLMRSPVGAERTVVFKNTDAATNITADLYAIYDDLKTLNRTDQGPKIALTGWPEKIIEQKLLPGNVGSSTRLQVIKKPCKDK